MEKTCYNCKHHNTGHCPPEIRYICWEPKESDTKSNFDLLNECAAIVCENMGYVYDGFDFSKSNNPRAKMCFAIAVRVHNHIKDSQRDKGD